MTNCVHAMEPISKLSHLDVDRNLLDNFYRDFANNLHHTFFSLDDRNFFELNALNNLFHGDCIITVERILGEGNTQANFFRVSRQSTLVQKGMSEWRANCHIETNFRLAV